MQLIKLKAKQHMQFNFIQKFIIQQMENLLLQNFLVNIAGLEQDWTPDSFVDETVADLKS